MKTFGDRNERVPDRTLVILAGGQSSRMGRDKTFLPYKDTTFLGYLIRRARPFFSDIWISAGPQEHAQKIQEQLPDASSESLAGHIVPDRYDRIGPMGGILSVFESIRQECFVLLAVDIPEADMEVLAALADLAVQRTEAAMMLKISDSGFAEACAAAYNRKAYRLMKASYEQGEYSLRKALGEDQICCLGISELKPYLPGIFEEDLQQAFRNINTPQDYGRSLNSSDESM